jgi:hypothetical protein
MEISYDSGTYATNGSVSFRQAAQVYALRSSGWQLCGGEDSAANVSSGSIAPNERAAWMDRKQSVTKGRGASCPWWPGKSHQAVLANRKTPARVAVAPAP